MAGGYSIGQEDKCKRFSADVLSRWFKTFAGDALGRVQTRETLRPYLVEEVFELDQALSDNDRAAIRTRS